MLSIPRDIYVDNEMVGWGTRINSVYEYVAENNDYDYALAMNELRSEIERITGVDLHYYAKIDFEGFVDIVDAIGGITVDVEEEIYDIAYPADPGSAYLYQTFYLEAGEQELDGETALKYVRSRHTSSDFDRARRQQEVLNAVKNKALSIGFLLNPVKIKNTLSVLADNFETDLTLTEMMNFASLASDFSGDSIVSAVLSDDIWSAGGFLYPPEREYYGGAYVLIPYTGPEDFSEVHTFCDLLFHHPEVIADQVSIQILNATGVSGLAGMNYYHLTRYGFNVVDTENALNQDLATTRIFPSGESNAFTEETSEALNYLLLGEILDTAPEEYALWETDAELIIELGTDFYEYYTANEDLFYYEFLY